MGPDLGGVAGGGELVAAPPLTGGQGDRVGVDNVLQAMLERVPVSSGFEGAGGGVLAATWVDPRHGPIPMPGITARVCVGFPTVTGPVPVPRLSDVEAREGCVLWLAEVRLAELRLSAELRSGRLGSSRLGFGGLRRGGAGLTVLVRRRGAHIGVAAAAAELLLRLVLLLPALKQTRHPPLLGNPFERRSAYPRRPLLADGGESRGRQRAVFKAQRGRRQGTVVDAHRGNVVGRDGDLTKEELPLEARFRFRIRAHAVRSVCAVIAGGGGVVARQEDRRLEGWVFGKLHRRLADRSQVDGF